MTVRLLQGDALSVLRTLPSESVQCVVTSPPYYSLRAYSTDPQVWGGDPEHGHEWGGLRLRIEMPPQRGDAARPKDVGKSASTHGEHQTAVCPCGAWRGELGSEPTPALFIEHLVSIFDEVWRVCRKDATVWVNLGDSYSGSTPGRNDINRSNVNGFGGFSQPHEGLKKSQMRPSNGIPAKNLLLIPERFALAMQDRGWIVRSRIAWCKKSAMPESVRDRPTSAWEHIWMFSKSARYFYDAEAVRQPHKPESLARYEHSFDRAKIEGDGYVMSDVYTKVYGNPTGANLRNFWLLGPEPSKEAHYAAFPTEIPKRAILAGTSARGQCPECGAPWVRISDREQVTKARNVAPSKYGSGRNSEQGGSWTAAMAAQTRVTSTTLGWQPGCVCSGPCSDCGHPSSDHRSQFGCIASPGYDERGDAFGCPCNRERVPPAEPRPCVVLDPFAGTGTTCLVADRLGRDAVGIELSPTYAEMARRRIASDEQLFSEPVTVETAAEQLDLFGAATEETLKMDAGASLSDFGA